MRNHSSSKASVNTYKDNNYHLLKLLCDGLRTPNDNNNDDFKNTGIDTYNCNKKLYNFRGSKPNNKSKMESYSNYFLHALEDGCMINLFTEDHSRFKYII